MFHQKVGGVGGIRSAADEVTQTFRIEKSLACLSEDLKSTGECFAWGSHRLSLQQREDSMTHSKTVFPVGRGTQKPMVPSRHQHVMGRWLDFMNLCLVMGMVSGTAFESCTPKSRCKQCRDLTLNSLGDIRVTVCF